MNNKKKSVKRGGDPRPEGYISVPSKDYKEKADFDSDRTSGLKPAKKKAGGYMKKNKGGPLKKIDPQKQPGLAALKKKSPETVKEMGFMKSGGYMKRNKGGRIGRGCGAALRGGGKVMKY